MSGKLFSTAPKQLTGVSQTLVKLLRPRIVLEVFVAAAVITFAIILAPKVMAMSAQLDYAENFSTLYAQAQIELPKPALLATLEEELEREYYLNYAGGNHAIIEAVYKYAHELDKDLIFALLKQESSFNPLAHNANYNEEGDITSMDRGLFQLNSKSYPGLTKEEFYDILINTKHGTSHLRDALAATDGDTRKALYRYNSGRSHKPPRRTIAYAEAILANMELIKAERTAFIAQNISSRQLAMAVY
jgi:soluble lytic murein transglycosylase-like protein